MSILICTLPHLKQNKYSIKLTEEFRKHYLSSTQLILPFSYLEKFGQMPQWVTDMQSHFLFPFWAVPTNFTINNSRCKLICLLEKLYSKIYKKKKTALNIVKGKRWDKFYQKSVVETYEENLPTILTNLSISGTRNKIWSKILKKFK